MAPRRGTRKPVITAAQRRKVVELAEAGKGRNAIATETGVGLGTVSKIVSDAGLSFDRKATKAATEAKRAESAARRAELASTLLDDGFKLRGQIWEPCEYIDHGGKDFDEARWQQPEPTPVDKLKLMQAASIALQRHMDLEKHDADEKAGDARSMLTQLGKALGIQPAETT